MDKEVGHLIFADGSDTFPFCSEKMPGPFFCRPPVPVIEHTRCFSIFSLKNTKVRPEFELSQLTSLHLV